LVTYLRLKEVPQKLSQHGVLEVLHDTIERLERVFARGKSFVGHFPQVNHQRCLGMFAMFLRSPRVGKGVDKPTKRSVRRTGASIATRDRRPESEPKEA
jgi:hypothetical protein